MVVFKPEPGQGAIRMIMKKILFSLLLGLLAPSLYAAEAGEPKTSPNILLMMCDDMG